MPSDAPKNNNRQSLIFVHCQKREFEFFLDDLGKLYFVGDRKEPTYLGELSFSRWHYLVLQVVLTSNIFGKDKFFVNVIINKETVSSIAIDFP